MTSVVLSPFYTRLSTPCLWRSQVPRGVPEAGEVVRRLHNAGLETYSFKSVQMDEIIVKIRYRYQGARRKGGGGSLRVCMFSVSLRKMRSVTCLRVCVEVLVASPRLPPLFEANRALFVNFIVPMKRRRHYYILMLISRGQSVVGEAGEVRGRCGVHDAFGGGQG